MKPLIGTVLKILAPSLMTLALILPLAGAAQGCASLLEGVPVVASVVTDALSALEVIDAAATEYFRTQEVSAEVRTAYLNAYTRAVLALNAANHALRGVKDVDQQTFDQAFREFRLAFAELRQLLESKGLMTAGRLTVGGRTVEIPEPEALTFQVPAR